MGPYCQLGSLFISSALLPWSPKLCTWLFTSRLPSVMKNLVPSVTGCCRVCYRLIIPWQTPSSVAPSSWDSPPELFQKALCLCVFLCFSFLDMKNPSIKQDTHLTDRKTIFASFLVLKIGNSQEAMPQDSLHQSPWEPGFSCWWNL